MRLYILFNFLLAQSVLVFSQTNEQKIGTAILKRNIYEIEEILKSDIEINAKLGNNGESYLHFFAINNDTVLLKLFIKYGANLNISDNQGKTPLFYASTNSYIDFLIILLKNGANNKQKDFYGRTADYYTNSLLIKKILTSSDDYIRKYRTIQLLRNKLLFKEYQSFKEHFKNHGNLLDENNQNFIHWSVNMGDTFLIRYLVENGVNINEMDINGNTPIHIAITSENYHIIPLLLKLGAKINISNYSNQTPFQFASKYQDSSIIRNIITNASISNKLYMEKELLKAFRNNNYDNIVSLIEVGYPINIKNREGLTPLHYAVISRDFRTLNYLLKQNIALNEVDNYGNSPLHLAVLKKFPEVVKRLLLENVNINIKNKDGYSPIDLSQLIGDKFIQESISLYGTDKKLHLKIQEPLEESIFCSDYNNVDNYLALSDGKKIYIRDFYNFNQLSNYEFISDNDKKSIIEEVKFIGTNKILVTIGKQQSLVDYSVPVSSEGLFPTYSLYGDLIYQTEDEFWRNPDLLKTLKKCIINRSFYIYDYLDEKIIDTLNIQGLYKYNILDSLALANELMKNYQVSAHNYNIELGLIAVAEGIFLKISSLKNKNNLTNYIKTGLSRITRIYFLNNPNYLLCVGSVYDDHLEVVNVNGSINKINLESNEAKESENISLLLPLRFPQYDENKPTYAYRNTYSSSTNSIAVSDIYNCIHIYNLNGYGDRTLCLENKIDFINSIQYNDLGNYIFVSGTKSFSDKNFIISLSKDSYEIIEYQKKQIVNVGIPAFTNNNEILLSDFYSLKKWELNNLNKNLNYIPLGKSGLSQLFKCPNDYFLDIDSYCDAQFFHIDSLNKHKVDFSYLIDINTPQNIIAYDPLKNFTYSSTSRNYKESGNSYITIWKNEKKIKSVPAGLITNFWDDFDFKLSHRGDFFAIYEKTDKKTFLHVYNSESVSNIFSEKIFDISHNSNLDRIIFNFSQDSKFFAFCRKPISGIASDPNLRIERYKKKYDEEKIDPIYEVEIYALSKNKSKLVNKITIKNEVTSIGFSPDNKFILLGCINDNGDSYINVLNEGRSIFNYFGHDSDIESIEVNKEGTYMISSSFKEIILWNLNNNELVFKMYDIQARDLFDNTEIFIVDSNYYWSKDYDISKTLTYKYQNKILPFNQFDNILHRPDKVLEKLIEPDTIILQKYRQAYLLRKESHYSYEELLRNKYNTTSTYYTFIPKTTEKDKIKINFKCIDNKTKLKSFFIYVNGCPFLGKEGFQLADKNIYEFDTTINIPLISGDNVIEFYAENIIGNRSNIKQSSVFFHPTDEWQKKHEPDLYIIGIGISKYLHSNIPKLPFFDNDIIGFIDSIESKYNKTFNKIYAHKLINENATYENILSIDSLLEKSKANDIVILYYSGHGLKDDKNNYFFSCYNSDIFKWERLISYNTIENMLIKIQPQEKLFIINSCYSGNQNTNELEIMMNIFYDLKQKSGINVFTSTKSVSEEAFTPIDLKNWSFGEYSYFGYSLIKSISHKRRTMSLNELVRNTSSYTSKLSFGEQNPKLREVNNELYFELF